MTIVNIDTVKWTKSLQKSRGDKHLVAMSIDIFNEVFLGKDGVFSRPINMQNWRNNKKRYAARKKKNGFGSKVWVRTGSFYKKTQTPMTTLNQDGKTIKWNAKRKVATLNVHKAIGKAKGDKTKDEKTKRAIFWGNQLRRPFVSYTDQHIDRAKTSASKRLEKIFREEKLI